MSEINAERALLLLAGLKNAPDTQNTTLHEDYIGDELVADGLMSEDEDGFTTTQAGVRALQAYITQTGGE